MAKKNGGGTPSIGGNGGYGRGGNVANPFFPDETQFQGPGKSIQSPHGSIYEAGGVSNRNAFDDLPGLGGFAGGKKGRK